MDIKKKPKQRLENFSKLFLQIGLTLSLFVVYALIEHKTYDKNNLKNLGQATMIIEMQEDIPIIEMQEVKPPTKNTPRPMIEKIKVVEDDLKVEETIIESTETDESEAIIVNAEEIDEVEEVEEIIEDIPFVLIEDVPVYPGCKGNNKKLKDCFTKKITAFFGRNFNTELANDLGLNKGKKKMYLLFKIDKFGYVNNINVRAPHPKLIKEVTKIISSLPKMTPGKQRGMPVSVTYAIPITFEVR